MYGFECWPHAESTETDSPRRWSSKRKTHTCLNTSIHALAVISSWEKHSEVFSTINFHFSSYVYWRKNGIWDSLMPILCKQSMNLCILMISMAEYCLSMTDSSTGRISIDFSVVLTSLIYTSFQCPLEQIHISEGHNLPCNSHPRRRTCIHPLIPRSRWSVHHIRILGVFGMDSWWRWSSDREV